MTMDILAMKQKNAAPPESCPSCGHNHHEGACGRMDGFTPSGCKCVQEVVPTAILEPLAAPVPGTTCSVGDYQVPVRHFLGIAQEVGEEINPDIVTMRAAAIEVAESVIKAIRYEDGIFGIGFFNTANINEVGVQFSNNLDQTTKVRDKLQQIIADAIINGMAKVASNNGQKSTWAELVDEFHKFYYYPMGEFRHYNRVFWFGAEMMKNPMDLMVYQEIIAENKPDLIIETGTAFGGSALYLAHLCDLVNHGQVLTIDLENHTDDIIAQTGKTLPRHDRLHYWLGDSVSAETVAMVKSNTYGAKKVMVILDSDHSKEHVLRELDTYAPLVATGQYLIVEDTNINGHPVMKDHGDGPWEALEEWLPKHPEFIVDKTREHFIFSQNPGGYLMRL